MKYTAFAWLSLILLLPACMSTPMSRCQSSCEATAQALDRDNGPGALRQADSAMAAWQEKVKAGHNYTHAEQSVERRVYWMHGRALAKVGRLAEARDVFAAMRYRCDPDAWWELVDVLAAMGTREQAEAWVRQSSSMASVTTATQAILALHYNERDQVDKQLESVLWGESPRFMACFRALLGDMYFRRQDYDAALEHYRLAQMVVHVEESVARCMDLAGIDLRIAKVLAARGQFDLALSNLAMVDVNALHATGQRQELAALRAQCEQQAAAQATARGETTSPPPGLTLLGAIPRLQGLSRSESGDQVTWRAATGYELIVPKDAQQAQGYALDWYMRNTAGMQGSFTIAMPDRDGKQFWSPHERCYDYGLLRKGLDRAKPRIVLHENGDLFCGIYAFAGHGLYLSPNRPEYVGPCCFGRPLSRAWAIEATIASTPIVSDEAMVEARLADGSTFRGVAVCDQGVLVPTRHGSFTHPRRGAFIGWFKQGQPHIGGFFHLDNRLDLTDRGGMKIHSRHGGSEIESLGKWRVLGPNARWINDPYGWIPGRDFSVWDPQSGFELDVDNSLEVRMYQNTTRLALEREIKEHNKRLSDEQKEQQRRYEKESRERAARVAAANEEFRRTHPNWKEEAEQRRRAEEGLRVQFNEQNSNACLKCSGQGSIYQGGGVQQDWVWRTEGDGGWERRTVHRSGSMQQCPWCQGSGRR